MMCIGCVQQEIRSSDRQPDTVETNEHLACQTTLESSFFLGTVQASRCGASLYDDSGSDRVLGENRGIRKRQEEVVDGRREEEEDKAGKRGRDMKEEVERGELVVVGKEERLEQRGEEKGRGEEGKVKGLGARSGRRSRFL
ncbi:hypothetical protein E2C01_052309 [Portunus trituberculatus]|uniref:Uncharacterized protein n=1 Tax=Portunus trituberculatus TaxID=210409 RepID=A0A5B7GE29_PORTR|nr:hypothetical protein [Portunus trituberculatus]